MMPRKKRRTILIISILLVIIAIVSAIVVIYLTTDMFKSSDILFAKYIGQNMENLENVYHEIEKDDYRELMKQNKHTIENKVKVNYTENMGTTSENTKNPINQLKLTINGQVDNQNQYNYENIELLNRDEKVANVELIQNQNLSGIKFSDLFEQFLLVNNEESTEVLGESALVDKIDFNEFKEALQFSQEEKAEISKKYMNIINSNVAKENYSKQKDQIIQINQKKVNVNAYTLIVTKEQMNHIYIKILEELKQDEVILSKVDKIQATWEKYQLEEGNLREQFTNSIEELITEITKNNIGQDEAKITVYENYHNTVRTVIQSPEYEITVDVLSLQTENYIQISYQDRKEEKQYMLTYKKEAEEKTISFKNITGEKTIEYSFSNNQKISGNACHKNMIAKYEDDSNRVEAVIEQDINIVDNFNEMITFEEGKTINLNEMEEGQRQAVIQQVSQSVSEKVNELATNVISGEDLLAVLKTIGFIPNRQTIEGNGVTETEKNRFNSKYEILQGENLESEEILNLIEAIKENFVTIEVVSDRELRMKLDRFNKNEEMTKTLTTFIEGNRGKKYSTKVEYDKETGLVNGILLTMLEK